MISPVIDATSWYWHEDRVPNDETVVFVARLDSVQDRTLTLSADATHGQQGGDRDCRVHHGRFRAASRARTGGLAASGGRDELGGAEGELLMADIFKTCCYQRLDHFHTRRQVGERAEEIAVDLLVGHETSDKGARPCQSTRRGHLERLDRPAHWRRAAHQCAHRVE